MHSPSSIKHSQGKLDSSGRDPLGVSSEVRRAPAERLPPAPLGWMAGNVAHLGTRAIMSHRSLRWILQPRPRGRRRCAGCRHRPGSLESASRGPFGLQGEGCGPPRGFACWTSLVPGTPTDCCRSARRVPGDSMMPRSTHRFAQGVTQWLSGCEERAAWRPAWRDPIPCAPLPRDKRSTPGPGNPRPASRSRVSCRRKRSMPRGEMS